MKKGDKVVCIKDFIVNFTNETKVLVNINEIYTIDRIKKDRYVINGWWFEENGSKTIYKINNIYFTEENDSINEYFHNYFITLAEWREQQINSILE